MVMICFQLFLVAWLVYYTKFSILTWIPEVLTFQLTLLVCTYSIAEWGIWVPTSLTLCVMGRLNTNNFLFLFFSDFILIFFSLFFYFSFGQWRGTWYYSHMTGHMMWCHRPRTWWKDLEDDIRAHVYNIVALSRKWDRHEVVTWTIGQA